MKVEIPDCVNREWRLINDKGLSGPVNMARDAALASSVGAGSMPALRLYSFEPSCVTIGRFQDQCGGVLSDKCGCAGIDITRRPTGGLAIFHRDDFTYSVSIPHDSAAAEIKGLYFEMVAEAVIQSLVLLGIPAQIVAHGNKGKMRTSWCFESEAGVDIECGGKKICGSAQKIYERSVLQHGSLFLGPGSTWPDSIGVSNNEASRNGEATFISLGEAGGREYDWKEVAAAFEKGFSGALGIQLKRSALTPDETDTALRLCVEKYGNSDWISGKR